MTWKQQLLEQNEKIKFLICGIKRDKGSFFNQFF